eukprot:Opistho-1_new@68111
MMLARLGRMALSAPVAQARGLATAAAAATANVKPPLRAYGVTGRYAEALYVSASKQKQLDAVSKDMQVIGELVKKNPKFVGFLKDPTKGRTKKAEAVKTLFKASNFNPVTTNFFTVLAQNNRLAWAEDISTTFGKIMRAHRKEVECTVTTAKALDEASMKKVEAAVSSFAGQGQTLSITYKVDPAVIGGVIVNIEEELYVDLSVATKINKLTQALTASI